jgi:hypothetical protein
MQDDLTARSEREDERRSRVPEPSKPGDGATARPSDGSRIVDREVPIELTRTPDPIHAWLDGEIPESSVRGEEATRHMEFWKRLDTDLEVHRQMRAPTELVGRIMAALPATAPSTAVSWRSKPVTMNPVAVAAAAAGLLALGAALGATMHK